MEKEYEKRKTKRPQLKVENDEDNEAKETKPDYYEKFNKDEFEEIYEEYCLNKKQRKQLHHK